MRLCFVAWRFVSWMLVLLIVGWCFCPSGVAAQDSFAGTTAGQERGFFCWCPPGKFMMGSPENEAERNPDKNQVEVTLSRGFWMGKYEVTQAQYEFVMGKNPSKFKGVFLPVESVSWDEATEFCEKLTKMERAAGRLPQGWEYRLPTEAQWEYVCRAGTTTAYSFGDDAKQLGDYAWYMDNSGTKTHPVGEKKPNAWGLCDMHGNVFEWCRDSYQEKLPGGRDPEATEGRNRVLRGGSWSYDARHVRSASRYGSEPGYRFDIIGFRCAQVPVEASGK